MSDETKMTVVEAGRKGGLACREKHGPEHHKELGKRGGAATAQRGSEHFKSIGKLGGTKVLETRGREFFQAIGRKGAARRAELTRLGREAERQAAEALGKKEE